MLKMMVYAVIYFVITLLLQYLLHKGRKNGNQGTGAIWVGSNAMIVICIIGLAKRKINYLGAVVGFLMADGIGKRMGWH